MIGIDIVDINRIDLSDTFIHTILTEEELQEYSQFKTDKRRKEYIAGRFAAKEAIFKATSDKQYLHYSILHNSDGSPYILHHSELEVSISHDGNMAIAMVMKTSSSKQSKE